MRGGKVVPASLQEATTGTYMPCPPAAGIAGHWVGAAPRDPPARLPVGSACGRTPARAGHHQHRKPCGRRWPPPQFCDSGWQQWVAERAGRTERACVTARRAGLGQCACCGWLPAPLLLSITYHVHPLAIVQVLALGPVSVDRPPCCGRLAAALLLQRRTPSSPAPRPGSRAVCHGGGRVQNGDGAEVLVGYAPLVLRVPSIKAQGGHLGAAVDGWAHAGILREEGAMPGECMPSVIVHPPWVHPQHFDSPKKLSGQQPYTHPPPVAHRPTHLLASMTSEV